MSSTSKKLMGITPVSGAVEAQAIDFDGANDYLSRSTDLVGNADGKTFTFSAWVYTASTAQQDLYKVGSSGGFIVATENSDVKFLGWNSSGTVILNASVSGDKLPLNTFCHILISVDVQNISNRFVYINDGDVTSSVSWNTFTDDSIDFTKTPIRISSGFGPYKGRLSNVYLDYTYRDLSVEANRRLFVDYDDTGGLVPASGQASLSPILYLPMDDPDDPGRNDGTGGDFTLNGTIARSGRGPNQYNAAASTFDGSNDYLSRSSITGLADSSVLTCSFNIRYSGFSDLCRYILSV